MSFPAFLGVIGRGGAISFPPGSGWTRIWNFSQPELTIWSRTPETECDTYSHSAEIRDTEPAVFVSGEPLIASDCEFDANTRVKRIPRSRLPHQISRLYQQYGTRGFAFLEGHFSIVVIDPLTKSVLLVVDKFGCDDLYVHRGNRCVAFASHPSLIPGAPQRFNLAATAFFLAHEGFVPAPFTLFEDIETVGRAKCLRINMSEGKPSIDSERYWFPSRFNTEMSKVDAVERFHSALASAVESRRQAQNGILLSGGIDSALLANLAARRKTSNVVAMTGAIHGSAESEIEVRRAAVVASALEITHHIVTLDPRDDSLPGEWIECVSSWSGGTRMTLPLFCRFATHMRKICGAGYSAFSGQMADTLADNNYTLPSLGYAMRRMLFSSWFLKVLPLARPIAPHKSSAAGRGLIQVVRGILGQRLSEMTTSLLDGLSSKTRFYEGRVFGFGEMPGRSCNGFPVLTKKGFDRIADWYSSNFVAPVIADLDSNTFYSKMLELSLDMVMLHLDTRLMLHAFRLGGGSAELPFLDSRVVKVLTNLPYSARACYRKPKYVLDVQCRRNTYARADRKTEKRIHSRPSAAKSRNAKSFEELLLAGSLGVCFRRLLADRTVLHSVRGLNEFVDVSYIDRQVNAFQRGLEGVNCKFISRLAALEFWSQTSRNQASAALQRAAIA